MLNPNRGQEIESESINHSKQPLSTFGSKITSETDLDQFPQSKEPLATFGTQDLQKTNPENSQRFDNKKRVKLDPVQIVLAVGIFTMLPIGMYFVAGPISMITMAVGGLLSVYHLRSASPKSIVEYRKGRRGPSAFLLMLILSPFLLGGLVAYEGISLLESPTRIILLWGLTISFWSSMLFVPMSLLSKHREVQRPDLKHYPKVSVIIPAYNEEMVIKKTIDAVIEAQYPDKEIIVVDDGSTDRTLQVSKQFKNQIKILHKENGGKASALNYGIVYAKGEIIVIVDADTIIERQSIVELVKGYADNEAVGAVAANIKIKNRVNWITKCQALEFITGLQIIRRAFDEFGAISIIPGALGSFKKKYVTGTGSYGHETIVEDFDQTIKLLKTGHFTQGSDKAVGYTEAPSSVREFAKQRKRWYRGNIQVLNRHRDALTNTRFGNLQKITLPYAALGMIVSPIIGLVTMGIIVYGFISGDALFQLQAIGLYTIVYVLMGALAIRIDKEDPKLLLYTGFMLFGYRQIVDFLLLRAIAEQLIGKKAIWTSAKRTGE